MTLVDWLRESRQRFSDEPMSVATRESISEFAAGVRRRVSSPDTTPDHISETLAISNHRSAQEHGHDYYTITVADGANHEHTDAYHRLRPRSTEQFEEFQAAVDTVVLCLNSDRNTLVHCYEGRERAPTVTATALAAANDVRLGTALVQIGHARPLIEPPNELVTLGLRYLEDLEQ